MSQAPSRGKAWPRHSWHGAALVVAICVAYLPVRHAGFIWDDDLHLTANPRMLGWAGLAEIWSSASANYFPFVLSHLWVLHACFGFAPLPYHVANVVMHALAAVLLWRALVRLEVPGAWLGAALWALHPVQVESVAWISELKNTQSAVFFFAAIGRFLRWLDGTRRLDRYYLETFVCAVLAILSKASAVMLPVALGLCWWWRSSQRPWRELRWLGPFLLISLAAAGWTIWEQRFHSGASGPDWELSGPERLVIAGKVGWFYLGKLLWPNPLIFIYPRWTPDAGNLISYLPGLAWLGVLAWLWSRRNRGAEAAGLAVLYFLALLFPVMGFFNVYFFRYSYVADHFQYLASAGPLALGAAAMTLLFRRVRRNENLIRLAGISLLLGVLGLMTAAQCAVYRDPGVLWRATAALNPSAWLAQHHLGVQATDEGRTADAIAAITRALAARPDDPDELNNLGNAYLRAGRVAEAVAMFERSLQIKPGMPAPHTNLGNALLQLGREADAVAAYQAALRIDPAFTLALNNLGSVLLRKGRASEAVPYYESALRSNPGHLDAHVNLASALLQSGQPERALTHCRIALQLDAAHAGAHENLAIGLAQTGRTKEAEIEFETAIRLNPGNPSPRQNLERLRGSVPQK